MQRAASQSPKRPNFQIRKDHSLKEQKSTKQSSPEPFIRRLASEMERQKTLDNPEQLKELFNRKIFKNESEKLHTENNVVGIKYKTPRKMTELSSRLETELPTLEKKHSMTNSSVNLKKSTMNHDKAYRRFHEVQYQLRDIPLMTTKKYKDFAYKDKYYDINRRTLQQTNIYISADAWLAFDYNEGKCIRGWKVQMVRAVHNLTKLLLVQTAYRIIKRLQFNIKQLKMQILVPEKTREMPPDPLLTLQNETIISFLELMYGLMLTNSQQLYSHLYVNLGYLAYCHNFHDRQPVLYSQIVKDNLVAIPRDRKNQLQTFRNATTVEMTNTIKDLKLLSTELDSTDIYQMNTCCLDLCILFMHCLDEPMFRDMFCGRSRTSTIRCSMGYNYMQDSKIKWLNEITWNDEFIGLTTGWRENKGISNNSLITYHRETDILIVLMDSRFHSSNLDMKRVIQWCSRNMKVCPSKKYLEQCRETFSRSSRFMQ